MGTRLKNLKKCLILGQPRNSMLTKKCFQSLYTCILVYTYSPVCAAVISIFFPGRLSIYLIIHKVVTLFVREITKNCLSMFVLELLLTLAHL